MPFRPGTNLVCMGLYASPLAELCLRTLVVVLGAQVIFDMSEFPKALEKVVIENTVAARHAHDMQALSHLLPSSIECASGVHRKHIHNSQMNRTQKRPRLQGRKLRSVPLNEDSLHFPGVNQGPWSVRHETTNRRSAGHK